MKLAISNKVVSTIDEELAAIFKWCTCGAREGAGESFHSTAYRGPLSGLSLTLEKSGWHYWSGGTGLVGPFATREDAGEALYEAVREEAIAWRRARAEQAALVEAKYAALEYELDKSA